MFERPALFTDYYELTMAQGYFLSGKQNTRAVFDYFFRNLPFDGGYVIFAGLSDLLEVIHNYRFHDDEISYLNEQGFHSEFLNYLKEFRFQGNIYSVQEGDIVFANEPVLHVEGTIIEAQILETVVLNILNFESLIATKASRIKYAAKNKTVIDFGLRRAQGLGGMQASKASIIGGADGTSNVSAAYQFGVPAFGTMAHSWIQFFKDELTAFRTYAKYYPDSSVLLVDTYDTLKSGIPNAIIVGKELLEKGHKLKSIRLDSGDLAYLSKKSRKLLDDAGLDFVTITASNQLDEHVVKSLLDQGAPIDHFGAGTKLVTAYDDPALDGVYKLSAVDGNPVIKLSDNVEKITLPGIKKILRFLNDDGSYNSDGIVLENQTTDIKNIYHPQYPEKFKSVSGLSYYELLQTVVQNGKVIIDVPTVTESAAFAKKNLMKLNDEHKRFDNPHVYKVGISRQLKKVREELIKTKSK